MIYTFRPIYKSTPWGGGRIRELKGLPPAPEPVGESWEISAMPGMESVVAAGPEKGLTLTELIRKRGVSLLGRSCMDRYGLAFPLLVKFLDARQWISLQVHPDDEIVKALEQGLTFGKSEMWHVVEAMPGAQLIAGFKPGVTLEDYLSAEGSDRLLDLVERHDVEPGQEFFIEAGRIHTLGAGLLVAEIQQSCDCTYRVYDYGRPRQLHLDKARKALKFSDTYPVDQPLSQFSVKSHENVTAPVVIEPAQGSFQIIMVLRGGCMVDNVQANAGTTLLISADHGPARLIPAPGCVSYLTVAV